MISRIFESLTIGFFLILSSSTLYAEKKLNIITTLFPTYDFARQIGKNKAHVSLLLPPGVEPHSFEPTPRDIVRINKADLFIYTGIYMEPWTEDILAGLTSKSVKVVDVSKGIKLLAVSKPGEAVQPNNNHNLENMVHEDKAHIPGEKDPHIWLDLKNDQIIIKTITRAMIQKDPENEGFYLRNSETYDLKLADLDQRFKTGLSNCKYRTIVSGGHFTFSYLAKKHQLRQISAYNGFAPNAEPSPKAVAEIIKKLRKSGIKVIYHEELINPKIARIISQETGAQLKMLHGAHNVSRRDLKQGTTFLEIMKKNLNQLQSGLECR